MLVLVEVALALVRDVVRMAVLKHINEEES